MIDCEAYPEEIISLKRIRQPGDKGAKSGTEWASLVMDVMNELGHIFKPLTADLSLYCYYKDCGSEDWDIEPLQPFWHLRELDIPEEVYIPEYTRTIFNEVSEIDKKSVVAWVEKALKQESPRPDIDTVNVNSLNFRTIRAKIINDRQLEGRETFIVDYFRQGTYEFPLKRINDELWVYSPIPEVCTKPSFNVRTDRYMGAFDIEVYWYWWTKTSPEDVQALEQAVINVINTGLWKLKFISEYLEMPRLKTYAEKVGSDKY